MRHFPIAGGAARHRFCCLPRRGGGEKAATANRRRRSCLVGKGAVPPGAVSRSAGNALWLPPEKPSSARGFGVIPPCVCKVLSHGKQRCFAPLPKRLGESAALRVGKCRISRMKVRQFEAESAALFTGASDALFSAVPNPSPARLAQGVPAFRRTYKYTTLYDVMFLENPTFIPENADGNRWISSFVLLLWHIENQALLAPIPPLSIRRCPRFLRAFSGVSFMEIRGMRHLCGVPPEPVSALPPPDIAVNIKSKRFSSRKRQ